MADSGTTIGQLAEEVRSKNAGPFWMTLDIFLRSDEDYEFLITSGQLSQERIGQLYEVDPDTVQIFSLPSIRAIHPRDCASGNGSSCDRAVNAS